MVEASSVTDHLSSTVKEIEQKASSIRTTPPISELRPPGDNAKALSKAYFDLFPEVRTVQTLLDRGEKKLIQARYGPTPFLELRRTLQHHGRRLYLSMGH